MFLRDGYRRALYLKNSVSLSTLGHADDSVKAGCVPFLGPCKRSQELINKFYAEWPKNDVISYLSSYYSSTDLATVTDDKLIDLFIYTAGENILKQPATALRSKYGYETDYDFGFTPRDLQMREDTSEWVKKFFLKVDPCDPWRFMLLNYSKPNDDLVKVFLSTEEVER